MAGDWIKVEKATARKPEVLQLSALLDITPDHAFGLCFRFWCWCDDQLTNGHAVGVTNVTLDAVIGHAGFSTALITVGWLEVRSGSLSIPHFDRHLSDSAKNRALSGKRKGKQREKCHAPSVTKTGQKRDQRREEKSNYLYPDGGVSEIVIPKKMQSVEVQQAAAMWFAHLDVVAPDKLPIRGSPQEQAFWLEAAKLGPVKFVQSVEHCVARGWINLRLADEPASKGGKNGRQSQRAHAAKAREEANADAFADLYASIGGEESGDPG